MPNTRPRAILTGNDVIWYRDEIKRAFDEMPNRYPFEPLMTVEIRDNTTPQMIAEAHCAGAVAGKVYPLGVTTNSDEGLRDFENKKISETFRAMQDAGMLLLIHGELDRERILVTKREEVFLPTLFKLAEKFPNLKIVLEHISTKAAAESVQQLGKNVAATITVHHLCLTLNDVVGYGIQPHHGCMPMPKDFDDRDMLIAVATSDDPKFFSDRIPRLIREKGKSARKERAAFIRRQCFLKCSQKCSRKQGVLTASKTLSRDSARISTAFLSTTAPSRLSNLSGSCLNRLGALFLSALGPNSNGNSHNHAAHRIANAISVSGFSLAASQKFEN